MERTRHKGITTQQLKTFASQIVGRAQLMSQLGFQYGGSRDIYKALGYDVQLDYKDFLQRYTRQDIAKAIIDRPVKATWQGPLDLIESEQSEDTAFEKAWGTLNRNLKLKSILTRIDKLTGIGKYGVLVLGLDDVQERDDFEKPVVAGTRKLLYVKPFGEKSAKITTFVSDPKDKRYGNPLLYTIEVAEVNEGSINSSTSFIKIHHTRVLHITDDPMESEIFGTPRLESVYNRLMDLEKLVGGDAEMFWRGARPGYEGKVDPEYQMTEEMKEDLKDQIDEYENNLRRILVNEGVDLKALAQQIADPANHVDIQIQMISAVTGIPKRILTGSERGELSSAQDSTEWKDYVQTRREDHAEPNIVRPFVDKLIELKILPKPTEDYTVKWNDLYSLSEKARVEVGKGRANALREYTYSPMAQAVVTPDGFLEYFLGFTKEQITLISAMRDKVISEEELTKVILDELTPPEPKVIPAGRPIPTKKSITAQMKVSKTDWKKIYEDGGAHWMEDLQPSQFAQEFAQKLIAAKKKSLLEIGCANGKDSILFAIAGLKVTGIDIVPEAVTLSKENAEKVGVEIDFQEGNVEKLTFEDASFDAVYSISVLHSTNMKKSVPEIARVLKSKGLALIYIYSGTEFIELFKNNGFTITNFYTSQDEEFDEVGEKHSIIVIETKKK